MWRDIEDIKQDKNRGWKIEYLNFFSPDFGPLNNRKVKVKLLSHGRLFETLWTVAYQAPPSMGFYRQEYWGGLPFASPGDLPKPGIKPGSPTLEAEALTSEPPW